jgi:hypothetical protein
MEGLRLVCLPLRATKQLQKKQRKMPKGRKLLLRRRLIIRRRKTEAVGGDAIRSDADARLDAASKPVVVAFFDSSE